MKIILSGVVGALLLVPAIARADRAVRETAEHHAGVRLRPVEVGSAP